MKLRFFDIVDMKVKLGSLIERFVTRLFQDLPLEIMVFNPFIIFHSSSPAHIANFLLRIPHFNLLFVIK